MKKKQIQVNCTCGNSYALSPIKGYWTINICGPITLTCECGNIHDLLEYGIEALKKQEEEVSK